MASQSVERRRCLSCNRWGGERSPGQEADTVDYDENNDRGLCQDGPWHNTLRRGPRNACGQWIIWAALVRPAPASDLPAPPAASVP